MNPTPTTNMRQEFASPHKWCDSRCQRCPIGDCPVRLGVLQHDWGAQLRAEAPASPALRVEDVLRDFLRVMQGVANSGDSEDAGREIEPGCRTSLRATRHLSEVACRFFAAVVDAMKASGGRHAARESDEVLTLASLLRIKAARLDACGDEVGWELEVLPNLLLMGTTARDLEGPLQSLLEEVPKEARQRLDACYGELRDAVAEVLTDATTAHELLARMIEQRRAPSPFCTVQ